jgi:hypothetical protein
VRCARPRCNLPLHTTKTEGNDAVFADTHAALSDHAVLMVEVVRARQKPNDV